MSSLRLIRDRLNAVRNIKKVTTAMELVAGSRLHKAQAKATQIRPYLLGMKTLLAKICVSSDLTLRQESRLKESRLKESRQNQKIGVVIIGSDRGLCGAHNSTLFHAAEHFLKDHDPQMIELILFGYKASCHFRSKKWTICQEILDWGGKLPFARVQELSNAWFHRFTEGHFKELWVIYTHFSSILVRPVQIEKFLPFTQENNLPYGREYIFETAPDTLYCELLPRYLSSKVQSILNESYASELAARALAMKSASHNAQEKIEDLTQLRNKVRQEGITREMLEITSGAMH